jgi:hypothetical protein
MESGLNYMKPYWERRLAECTLGREYAEKQLGRLALLEMEQLRIPLEQYMEGWYGTDTGSNTDRPDSCPAGD